MRRRMRLRGLTVGCTRWVRLRGLRSPCVLLACVAHLAVCRVWADGGMYGVGTWRGPGRRLGHVWGHTLLPRSCAHRVGTGTSFASALRAACCVPCGAGVCVSGTFPSLACPALSGGGAGWRHALLLLPPCAAPHRAPSTSFSTPPPNTHTVKILVTPLVASLPLVPRVLHCPCAPRHPPLPPGGASPPAAVGTCGGTRSAGGGGAGRVIITEKGLCVRVRCGM